MTGLFQVRLSGWWTTRPRAFAILFILGVFASPPSAHAQNTGAAPAASSASGPLGVAPHLGDVALSPTKRSDDCIMRHVSKTGETPQQEIRTYQPGAPLISVNRFLPAGANADFVLRGKLESQFPYFARIETDFGGKEEGNTLFIVTKDELSVREIPEKHPLILSGLASIDDTLVSIDVPDGVGAAWNRARVFVYYCNANSPSAVSAVNVHASSPLISSAIVWSLICGLYGWAAYGAMGFGANNSLRAASRSERILTWLRYLNPVTLTAGPDGRGSLSKLQILFFSVIVFGLLFYIVLRTGLLSDLSETILILLGITGISSTAAKAADQNSNQLTTENWLWLKQRGWDVSVTNRARWRDIVTTNGEFDVYRYQSSVFSLIVGVGLLASGLGDLSSFTVPTTLLGLLGMSQVVYLAGKIVGSSSMAISALNDAITRTRESEQRFRAAAIQLSPPATDVNDAKGRLLAEYANFKDGIADVVVSYKAFYAQDPPSIGDVNPRFS